MEERPVPESALDTLIEKFVPINHGIFYLEQSLNKEQINRLFDNSDEDYRFDPHNLSEVVPLSRVNPKFITNFKIEEIAAAGLNNITTSWKEITLDELERLVNIIRPVRSERHPLRYDSESLNTLELLHNQLQITSDLISKRLPFDTFAISSCVFDEAYGSRSSASHAEHFIKNAGPLYRVSISDMEERPLPESALDTLIDKFIPINRGTFYLEQSLNKEQINRLFDKCATANKEVVVNIGFGSLNLEGLVDYDKYYWEKVLLAGGGAAMSVDEDRRGLGLLLRHPSKDRIRWTWTDADQLFDYFLRIKYLLLDRWDRTCPKRMHFKQGAPTFLPFENALQYLSLFENFLLRPPKSTIPEYWTLVKPGIVMIFDQRDASTTELETKVRLSHLRDLLKTMVIPYLDLAMSTLAPLPNEIWTEILSWVTRKDDLFACSEVCHAWRAIVHRAYLRHNISCSIRSAAFSSSLG
uniref:F-box domain-containing protein n=1 Tax=Steinernema glaseri TaxID=37863 RepID=A0A1I7YPD0_9BILA